MNTDTLFEAEIMKWSFGDIFLRYYCLPLWLSYREQAWERWVRDKKQLE